MPLVTHHSAKATAAITPTTINGGMCISPLVARNNARRTLYMWVLQSRLNDSQGTLTNGRASSLCKTAHVRILPRLVNALSPMELQGALIKGRCISLRRGLEASLKVQWLRERRHLAVQSLNVCVSRVRVAVFSDCWW